MQQNTKVFRPKVGVRVLCVVIYVAAVVMLSLHLPFGISDSHRVWIVPIFVVFGALWLADVFLSRIILQSDGVRIVSISDFQRQTVPRAEIDSVTWERRGAALKLRDGKWVRLPNVGQNPQGLANTIRAWLKKMED